ncbi:MAG: cell wall-binding repeat-containing protein [Candidatus Limnocylindrales bacterium]
MRQIALALVASLIVALASLVPGSPATIHAATSPKVVIVVGPVEGTTPSYRSDAEAAAAAARRYTDNVITIYSPNATWAAVKPLLQGASLVIYLGHGNGFPSPYFSGSALVPPSPYPQDRVDGMGLNTTAGAGDSNTAYVGELTLRSEVRLAPGAVVILSHLCYSAGQSESGNADPTVTVARARVDNMAAGWIAAGARAVVAEPYSNPAWYVDQLFTANQTVDGIWRARPSAYGNVSTFASVRSAGFQAEMDTSQPLPSDANTALRIYKRALVTAPGARFGASPLSSATQRWAGADRYATAAAISAAAFAPGVPVAFVAVGTNFPDALAGAAAGGKLGGPVLLVTSGGVPEPTQTELARLKPAKIVVLGGTGVIPDAVAAALAAYVPAG